MKLFSAIAAALILAAFTATAFAAECAKDKPACGVQQAASKDPTEQDIVIDPVCGMDVTVKDAKYNSKYKGKTYYFCSEQHMKDFKKSPSKYIGKERTKKKG